MNVLNKTIECFVSARQRIAEGMKYLYEISEGNLWDNGEYSSFTEFVETGCGISKGFASKLLTVYKHYAIEGGVSHAKLQEVESEKLYLATRLPGTPERQLAKAALWSRQEILEGLASDENGECQHLEKIMICAKCHKRIE